MTSRERIRTAVSHREPDRIPVDFGGSTVTGIHISVVAALRDHYGLDKHPVKVFDTTQMLGQVEDDLRDAMGIDTTPVVPPRASFGFRLEDWKPWRMYDGLEILVPGGFEVTIDEKGDTLIHPQGDRGAPPSGRMPKDGYFFDAIIRQPAFDEGDLDPRDNVVEHAPISDADVDWFEAAIRQAAASGRAVMIKVGSGLGDIATIPGISLKYPKGIRDIAEWYMSTRTRPDYVRAMFEAQVEALISNMSRINARAGGLVDVIYLCGTDFGTQKSTFCSVDTYRGLWLPYYKRLADWIHSNTGWKVFKHSCGAVGKLLDAFIDSGFDIINPVQVTAAGMDPATLKSRHGDRITFWGGGVDTQKTLAFGTPGEVREQALRHLDIFSKGGGYVFNVVHNIQAQTPVANVIAMMDAVAEFNGARQ
ncbi:MAG: methyltransferase [Bryobacterales bacterium]|nr:methyltransferase [Bryobacterales bacterium]